MQVEYLTFGLRHRKSSGARSLLLFWRPIVHLLIKGITDSVLLFLHIVPESTTMVHNVFDIE